MSFNFGNKTPSGFTLPVTPITTASLAPGAAGDPKSLTPKPATNFFGTPTTTATGFLIGSTPAKTTPAVGFGLATTAATSGFSLLPATTAASTNQFTLGTSAPALTSTAFTPILPPASTSSVGSFSLSSTASTTVAPLKLAATGVSTAATTTAPSLSLGITTSTTQVPSAAATVPTIPGSLTFNQLEDSINKWTIDLEEQSKFFLNQAKQLNAWDHLHLSNNEKMIQLNGTIEEVKEEQKHLEQELDFILSQQNELEELIAPLEKELAEIPLTDKERFETYQLSEVIDSQLKQLSEDLKEIVEHLNESNKTQDTSDPMVQISRILNAHMNSLQWIDKNTAQISAHLDQISKLREDGKRNHLNL